MLSPAPSVSRVVAALPRSDAVAGEGLFAACELLRACGVSRVCGALADWPANGRGSVSRAAAQSEIPINAIISAANDKARSLLLDAK